VARSTASQAVKRNIRFSEVEVCLEPSRLAWRATRLLASHTRDRAAERLADPQRFDRRPSLAERAIRRSPPPDCVWPATSMTDCSEHVDDKDVDNGREPAEVQCHRKVVQSDEITLSRIISLDT